MSSLRKRLLRSLVRIAIKETMADVAGFGAVRGVVLRVLFLFVVVSSAQNSCHKSNYREIILTDLPYIFIVLGEFVRRSKQFPFGDHFINS